MKTLTFTKKTINGNDIYVDNSGIFIIKKRPAFCGEKVKWDLYVQNHKCPYTYDRVYNYAFNTKREAIEEVLGVVEYIKKYTPIAYYFSDNQVNLIIDTYF